MKVVKIAILDSGVKKDHKAFIGKKINSRSLLLEGDDVIDIEDGEDEVGHGTAVHYIIDRLTNNTELYDFKIYQNENRLTLSDLEKILLYIKNHETRFDIINISSGIVQCDKTERLQYICNEIINSGTIIVAAFDNDGAISFPAALDNVIGVDSAKNITSINDFIYVENSLVNVIGKNHIQKVAWTNPEYNMIAGNSFTCCYVTSKITKMIQEGNYESKNIGTSTIPKRDYKNIDRPYKIKRAAVFPFNKELHSLARYEDILNFKIEGYYSVRATGQIGRKISSLLMNCNNEEVIKDIDKIEWNKVDTLVLGHLDELNHLLKNDLTKLLLNKAIEHEIRIFSFDILDKYCPYDKQKQIGIYTPRISSINIKNNFGKLYKTNIPVVSVVGTSSSQGKFTLQLYIRKKLMEIGYIVGQIGTEPSSELFGIDFSFPIGYNSNIHLQPYEYLQIINQMIWDLSTKSEIILTGSQSSLATYSTNNINHFPLNHQIFLEAVQPDVVVLCINPYDEFEFIEKTLNLIKGLTSAKIIGAICFPLDMDDTWAGKMGKKVKITDEKRLLLKEQMLLKFDLKTGFLDNNEDLDIVIEDFLNYFANIE